MPGEIRQATLVDLPRCIEVGERYYREIFGRDDFNFGYSLYRWVELVKAGTGAAFFVEHQGEVIGVICGFFSPNIDTGKNMATVAHWCIDPRAKGHGVRLLWAFKRWAKEKGCASLVLTCSPETWDDKHEALYKKMGYKDFGRKFITEKL